MSTLYGLWADKFWGWFKDGRGVVFTTPNRKAAEAQLIQLKIEHRYFPKNQPLIYRIEEVDDVGLPLSDHELSAKDFEPRS